MRVKFEIISEINTAKIQDCCKKFRNLRVYFNSDFIAL